MFPPHVRSQIALEKELQLNVFVEQKIIIEKENPKWRDFEKNR